MSGTPETPLIAIVFEVDAAPRVIVTASPATVERIVSELPAAMAAVLIEALAQLGYDVERLRDLNGDVE